MLAVGVQHSCPCVHHQLCSAQAAAHMEAECTVAGRQRCALILGCYRLST